MLKDDLKSLVTQIYKNLLEQIDEQKDATKEYVVEYFKEAADIISTIKNDDIHSIDQAKLTFINAYKEIATRSLSSYEHTSDRFEELAQMHKETLNECHQQQINLPVITEKFNDIQTHMTNEVKKANATISELTKQIKTLEETSNIDALTKVFNRRALTSYLDEICSQENITYEFHLLILDIDDFKIINDTYGHIAGDKILIFIANILKKTLRDGDKIFRYGGEEFIIVLNRIDSLHCKKITHRLLELIRGNKLIYKGQNINVTMSIGTTIYAHGDTPDTLVARADEALYRAKHNGKNQIHTELKNGI